MNKCIKYIALSMFALTSSLYALSTPDQQKINNIIAHITHAWNEQQGHGFADNYAQKADFVNIYGMVFEGKEEIETRHLKILETLFKNSTFEVADINLHEFKPGVVIAHVKWKVTV